MALGYHTVPQVVVGYVLGAGVALGWLHVGETVVGPAAAADPGTARALYAACIVTSLLFARLAVRWIDEASEWVRKKREKKEAKRAREVSEPSATGVGANPSPSHHNRSLLRAAAAARCHREMRWVVYFPGGRPRASASRSARR